MERRTIELRATYDPNLDTLYLRAQRCTGSWFDSEDGIFFFTVFNDQDHAAPCGLEVHFFSEIWDDEEVIPDLSVRFTVPETELRGVDLSEVLQWAFETFVKPRLRVGQRAYREVGERQLEAVREDRGEADYET